MITTPIKRIYKPDVSRLISALVKIDATSANAKEKLEKIAKSVVSNEVAVASPFICDKKDFVATNNEELYNALCEAKEGQVIFVPSETVIDMSDYILTYEGDKQCLPILKKGVTLMGERGVGGCRGGIIRAQCVAHPLMAAEEGSRVTGLAFCGHDGCIEEKVLVEHQSVGIRIDGDDVRIDNCEIAGFARCAVQVNEYHNITVENCYIHDIKGVDAGFALEGENATVTLSGNTFGRINAIASEGVVAAENGSEFIEFPALTNPADYFLPAVCTDASNDDAGYVLLKKILCSDAVWADDLLNAISLIGNYNNFLKYAYAADADGEHFGPRSEFEPIGGGKGYQKIYTDGDYIVRNGKEFLLALESCKDGDTIFIPGDCVIDIADADVASNSQSRFTIDKSITIASNRGQVLEDGSVAGGGVLFWPNYRPFNFCFVTAPGVRLAGLVFKGPDYHHHIGHHTRSFFMLDEEGKKVLRPKGHSFYYKLHMGAGFTFYQDGCEVENCEVCGVNFAALRFSVQRPKDGPIEKPRSVGHKVHHCYIHHNQLNGLGYGVRLDWACVEVYANLFNYNRHSIAAAGYPEDAYTAHDNVEMGNTIGHNFDMHSGLDRGDGTDIAGEYCNILYNAFLVENHNPYTMRGKPVVEQNFDNNIALRPRAAYKNDLTHDSKTSSIRLDNVHLGKNLWNYAENPIVMKGGSGDPE